MCSIEEAWAGQLFENKPVQSQADIHRKYMSIPNSLDRNTEFSIGRNDPQPRNMSRGVNSQFSREPRIPSHMVSTNNADITFSSNMSSPMPFYGGESPRPDYMSIYDNAEQQMPIPMPSTTTSSRSNFNDINQAFTVSDTVNKFMNVGANMENPLLNEDNDLDRTVFNNKMKIKEKMQEINQSNSQQLEFQQTLMDIVRRMDRLEADMKHYHSKNMYDMVLYILVGMLIAFIVYSLLRK